MADKLTDADLMVGFNPQHGVTAEELEARQEDGETIDADIPESGADSADDNEKGTPAGADLTDVTLDGRTLRAPKDVADAFTREINRRDGTKGAELQQLRERLAHLEGRLVSETPAESEEAQNGPSLPNPELQIEDPAEYQKQLLAHVGHQQQLSTERLAAQYEEAEATKSRETSRRAAWQQHVNEFYSLPENKVLIGNEDIVDMVLQKHSAELAPLDVREGFKRLSELTKERLARTTGAAPDLKARRTPKPATLEGGGRRGPAPVAAASDKGPGSLSQAMKQRRQEAAQAFREGGGGRAPSQVSG